LRQSTARQYFAAHATGVVQDEVYGPEAVGHSIQQGDVWSVPVVPQ
jgi:hypothetical protein